MPQVKVLRAVTRLVVLPRAYVGAERPRPAALSVRSHLRCLRACGYFRVRAPPGSLTARAHALYRLFAILLTVAYLLQLCTYIYQERANVDNLPQAIYLVFCYLVCFTKQLVFFYDAGRVERLVDMLDEEVLNPRAAKARALLLAGAAHARRLHTFLTSGALCSCALWLVLPVLSYYRSQSVEFTFWFAAAAVYSYYSTSLVGFAFTSMDAFIGTVLLQCKIQFSILRNDLETLIERATEQQKRFGGDRDEIAMKLFVECIEHQTKICEVAALLQELFSAALLVEFTIDGWILVMASYNMVGSERVADAIYATAWHEAGVRLRRALLLGMEGTHRPLRPTAGRIVPLSLDTFFKILKSSYSFYAVLRQTK